MKPHEVRARRLELGLTVRELAFALNVEEAELLCIEAGERSLSLDEFEGVLRVRRARLRHLAGA
jgi:transcriptional regulator with XRE-family HTH domain